MSWSINYTIFPCKDCPDRYPACSAKCERYKAARAEYDRCKKARDDKHNANIYTMESIIKRRDKRAKGR